MAVGESEAYVGRLLNECQAAHNAALDENRELREALNEAIPVLKGFCDQHFTVTAEGYAEDVRGYTPQGIATLYKLTALRDRIGREPPGVDEEVPG